MMTKVLKKSLACCLALVLCLTCMIGALTVNAEVIEGSFEIKDASVTVGTETVDVEVTVTAPGANELLMKVTTDAGEVTAVTSEDVGVKFDAAVSDTIGLTKGDQSLDGFETAVIVVTVALTDAATAKDYDVTATLLSAASGVEEEYTIPEVKGTISVVEAAEPTLTAVTSPSGSTSSFMGVCQVGSYNFSGSDDTVVAFGILAMAAEAAPDEITVTTNGVAKYEDYLEDGETLDDINAGGGAWFSVSGLALKQIVTYYSFVPFVKLADGTYVYAEKVSYSFADYLVTRYNDNEKATAIIDAYYTMTSDADYASLATKYTALDSSKTYTKTYAEKTYGNQEETALVATAMPTASTSQFQFVYQVSNFGYTEAEGNAVAAVGILALDSTKYVSGDVDINTVGVYKYEDVLGEGESLATINAGGGVYVIINGLPLSKMKNDYIFVPFVKLADGTYVYAKSDAYCFADYFIDYGIKSTNSNIATRTNGFLDAYAKIYGALYTVEE